MFKKLKNSIIAVAIVAAVAASIIVPMTGSMCEDGQIVGYFLEDMIEGS